MDSETLEGLNLNYKEFRSLIEILDKKFQYLKAKAGQLAGAYVIFEAIMYVQVSTLPSAALRGQRWIPVCLSSFVSIAFWLTFINTVNDCVRTRRQQDFTFMEQEKLYRKIYSIRNGRKQNDGGAAASQQSLAKAFAFVRRRRYLYVGTLHSALFSFTLLVLYSFLSVPRR
ncbi:hypothetical protein Pfo_025110 [Paulownia fortunei]|nr:hypothetical protein Pfo_025110 [Paulownia fortunei]